MKEQAISMHNLAHRIPQVEKELHRQEPNHQPVPRDSAPEQQNRSHHEYREHKAHNKKGPAFCKPVHARFIIEAQKIRHLGNEIGEYKQEKNNGLNSDRFALHVSILKVVIVAFLSLRSVLVQVAEV